MKTVQAGEHELAVFDEGEGHTILLVHGFPLDHSMWRPLLPALVGPYRVIAPDLPGFGQSPPPRNGLTMTGYAQLLLDLLDELELTQPLTFVGLSMGGYIGWEFWQLAGSRVHSLIQCDTRAAGDDSEISVKRHELAAYVLQHGVDELPGNMLPRLLAESTRQSNPELVTDLTEMILRSTREGVAAASRAMANRQDSTHRLSRIQVPALLVCGAEDSITPVSEMHQIESAMPEARLLVVPEAGHMAPMENPAAVNEAITEFLLEVTRQ